MYFIQAQGKNIKHGLDCLVDLVRLGLENTSTVNIVIENMTKTNMLCQSWNDMKYVLDELKYHKRVGVCLDTAHCWGAGKKQNMNFSSLLDDFDNVIGLEKLYVIHLNDSKIGFGANRDRHEDILKGKITKTFWFPFLTHPKVKDIPIILETPSNCIETVRSIMDKTIIPKDFFETSIAPSLQTIQSIRLLDEVKKDDTTFKIESYLTCENWNTYLREEFNKEYFQTLNRTLQNETRTIYPPPQQVFSVFHHTQLEHIKVVILGQDPYHTPNVAHGLCFSVSKTSKIPPSLRNIFKELKQSIQNYETPSDGNLESWSKQGVFLLNTILTVCEKKPLSHKKIGWEIFTQKVLELINKLCPFVVFMLWGNHAKKAKSIIDQTKHTILESSHPSPFSANKGRDRFMGCNHFRICNEELKKRNIKPICW